MKFLNVLLGSLACAATANAQYFSQGWAPGKPVPTKAASSSQKAYVPAGAKPAGDAPAGPGFTLPKSMKELQEMFDITNILSSRPVVDLAAKIGINMTEKMQEVKGRKIWDPRIPLITDDNYGELIVNETMTAEEEADRVWFIVITTASTGQEGVSKFVDGIFDSAYNLTQEAGDLEHVKWGRIDYLNVTMLTTKWNIWSAPYLVLIKDRGQTLRFWKATQIRLNDQIIRQFLKEEGYKATAPWKTAYSPGGEREWIMEYFAIAMTGTYNGMMVLPKWLLYLITGAIGSLMIGLLHRNSTPAAGAQPALKDTKPTVVVTDTDPTPLAGVASPKAKKGAAKTKKGGKK